MKPHKSLLVVLSAAEAQSWTKSLILKKLQELKTALKPRIEGVF